MSESVWRITMLGGLCAQHGERRISRFETRKTSAVLALLALRLPLGYPRDLLAEHLWPEDDPEAIRNRLRQALSSLRKELDFAGSCPGVIEADRTDVRLLPAMVETDVAEFEHTLIAVESAGDRANRIGYLRRAVELYAGELLPGYYEDWILQRREALSGSYRDALFQLGEELAAAGELEEAIEFAHNASRQDALREDAHCLLMRIYAQAGRAADVIRQYKELERVLREEMAMTPSKATSELMVRLRLGDSITSITPKTSIPAVAPNRTNDEPTGGAVPLISPFYVVRPTDAEFHAALSRGDSIVLVKGPRQIGKTSLLARGLQKRRESSVKVVLTDLQKLSNSQLATADSLLFTLAESIADQLDLESTIESIWNTDRGWNVNFERFLRRLVLKDPEVHVVWALDEVDRLFTCPYGSEVFGLFRSWHNERALAPDGPWSRLTLAMAYATEAHLFITDLNQSPFNVGTRLTLCDFNLAEVTELNRRHGLPLQESSAVRQFYALVGGHPYLVRRGLYALTSQGFDIEDLDQVAEREDGPFGDHLRRMLTALERDELLTGEVRVILQGQPCADIGSFYRLRSAGIVRSGNGEHPEMRCGLYERYLSRRLL